MSNRTKGYIILALVFLFIISSYFVNMAILHQRSVLEIIINLATPIAAMSVGALAGFFVIWAVFLITEDEKP